MLLKQRVPRGMSPSAFLSVAGSQLSSLGYWTAFFGEQMLFLTRHPGVCADEHERTKVINLIVIILTFSKWRCFLPLGQVSVSPVPCLPCTGPHLAAHTAGGFRSSWRRCSDCMSWASDWVPQRQDACFQDVIGKNVMNFMLRSVFLSLRNVRTLSFPLTQEEVKSVTGLALCTLPILVIPSLSHATRHILHASSLVPSPPWHCTQHCALL